ncbi:ADP-ribosyltransferase [Fischerella sp. PCC 9605]|uniref:ADP-ribosyltransferase n=1 Tax=Fischerella sp. PCC 9605 TaxID=1173024 RepID=UPI00047ADEF3|nr:ADP-ribosyltransferase [Fischerella sp. PCC 9605]
MTFSTEGGQIPPTLLTSDEEARILSFIPTANNPDPLYDVGYHESKIQHTLAFAPGFTRAEAWSIAMYLGPSKFYQGMNLALAGSEDLCVEEREQFLLISLGARSALNKLPSVTTEQLSTLPHPPGSSYTDEPLVRYVTVQEQVIERYEPEMVITEPRFTSTTYWQIPIGQMQQYAQSANLVFRINYLPNGSQGKYVDPIKRVAREGEVLFPPDMTFIVRRKLVIDYPISSDARLRRMNVIEMDEYNENPNQRAV